MFMNFPYLAICAIGSMSGFLAIILGIVSLVRISRSEGRRHGRKLSIAAIILGTLTLPLLGVAGISIYFAMTSGQPVSMITELVGARLLRSRMAENFINGTGNIISQPREVSDFDSVSLTGTGNLVIAQTGAESLTITADDNLLPYLTSTVKGSRLILGSRSNTSISPTQEITYRLTVKHLNAMEVSGSGQIDAKNIDTERLAVQLSGAGSVTISGKSDSQEVSIEGIGSYKGENLQSKTGMVSVSGSGEALVQVSDRLDARISGCGSVKYIGDPIVQQSISGIGTISKSSKRPFSKPTQVEESSSYIDIDRPDSVGPFGNEKK